MPKKNIVLIITGLTLGGAEKQVCLLADKFVDLGHTVTLISLGVNGMVYPSNKCITIYELGMRKGVISFITTYIKLKNIIRDLQPDVVHSHMVHANILTRLLRLSIPIKNLISSAHSNNDGGFFRILAYRITDHLANISTNVSQGAVDSFIKKKATKPGRMIPMYNGIDLKRFSFSHSARERKRKELNIDDHIRLVLSVGRLTAAKNYKNLLLAFSMLNNHTNIHLAIIGEGDLDNDLKEFSLRLNIKNKVHWLGLQHDIPDWLSACDVFVLSSQWEGFGLVIAEAMACQRLVVATNVGGIMEVMGNSSLLVPSSNPDALRTKIFEVLNYDIEYKNNLVNIGRSRIEFYFSIDKLIQKWLSLYSDINNKNYPPSW